MMEKDKIVELESLKDLERIVGQAKKWGLNLVVVGGYAVRAYTIGYRYTKDIDFVSPRREMGELIALLKDLGYKVRETSFGLKGKKKLDGGFINLDISLGDIWDVSTNKRYPIDDVLKESRAGEISGFFEEGREVKVKASIIPLEDLMIAKLMTRGREKDTVDVLSLLIDRWDDLDLKKFSSRGRKADLDRHIRNQILNLIGLIRSGEGRKTWLKVTGQRLMRKTETGIIKSLKEMEKALSNFIKVY